MIKEVSMMPTGTQKVIHIFYCYAHEDKTLRDQLDRHLSNLRRQNQIATWYDREISPGINWEQEIDTHLSAAHLVLLLVSPDFMDSDYCYGIEMKKALEKHMAGTARVVPIILRDCDWEGAPFSQLQALPTDALPVTSWVDRDAAFANIARGIRKTVQELQTSLIAREWLSEGSMLLFQLNRFEEALAAFEQAIRLDPNLARAYHDKGLAILSLNRFESGFEEALAAYEQAIRLDPNFAELYYRKGDALSDLKRHEEALAAFEQAIHLDLNYANAYVGKGNALTRLERYEEALTAYEQAIRLDPNDALAYYNKCIALQGLGKIREAQQAYRRARELGL